MANFDTFPVIIPEMRIRPTYADRQSDSANGTSGGVQTESVSPVAGQHEVAASRNTVGARTMGALVNLQMRENDGSLPEHDLAAETLAFQYPKA